MTRTNDNSDELWQAACKAVSGVVGRNDGWAVLARYALQRASWALREPAEMEEAAGLAIYYASHGPGEKARARVGEKVA